MTIVQQQHATRFKPPFYHDGDSCGLHRYLDPDFVNRFKQDIRRRQFSQIQFAEWLNDERHSCHGQQPVLRLPLHRAFHLVSCEVVCDHPLGQPALDPRRIVSAGFVIRKLGGGREQAWMLEDGEALGWQAAPTERRDPDVHRRLCANGVLHKRDDQPSYSGEETHPLHVLQTTDATGKSHTLLYGYLPLGGFYYQRDPGAAIDPQSQQAVLEAAAESMPWPFGFRKPLEQIWRTEHSRPVEQGRPSKAMFELLRLLVNRYHLGENKVEENEALKKYCERLWFHDAHLPASLRHETYNDGNSALFAPYRKLDLFSYLKACFANVDDNPLVRWIIRQEKAIDAAGGLDRLEQLETLPNSSGSGSLNLSLFLLAEDAQELRALLGQRLRDQTLSLVREIPLPKFSQNAEDLFQIVPFVRYRCHLGREQIQWADAGTRSIPFRVAAPFDPEASRPSLIQIPSLADLKRGLAKGAAMITPADTFNLINSLKMNKGVGPGALPEHDPGPGPGIQWICSFSLPVITIVAMILLTIMISLLNIIFCWMPWVRICLPFPKRK